MALSSYSAFGATLVLSIGLVQPAKATVLEDMSLARLVEEADAIVYGEAVGTGVRMDITAPGGPTPVTTTTLRVHEWLAGADAGGETVEIQEIGGRHRNTVVHVAGTPVYRVGSEFIVFLRRTEHGFSTLGMVQGQFVVERGLVDEPRVRRDRSGVGLVQWSSDGMALAEGGRSASMPLSAFLGYVRDTRRQLEGPGGLTRPGRRAGQEAPGGGR